LHVEQWVVPYTYHGPLTHPFGFFDSRTSIFRPCIMYAAEKAPLNKSGIMISGFRRDVDEISAFLGYYAAHSGNRRFGKTYQSCLQGSRRRCLKMGPYRLSRNVVAELPLCAAQYRRRSQISNQESPSSVISF